MLKTIVHKSTQYYTNEKIGEVYNIKGGNEKNNLKIIRLILEKLGKPETPIEHITDRLRHNRIYSLDATKTRNSDGN